MVVMEKLYEIVDRPSTEVTKAWKELHIVIYLLAGISGLAAYIVFSDLRQQFGDNCLLFPYIQFKIVDANSSLSGLDIEPEPGSNATTKTVVDKSKTVWGSDELCNYLQYVPVMSTITGLIFVILFYMCPRGGSRLSQSGIKQPWHIVVPSIVLSTIFSIIIFHTCIYTKQGLDAFCTEFNKVNNKTSIVCNKTVNEYVYRESTFRYLNAYSNIEILRAALSVCVIAWVLAVVILLLRCCCFAADFKMMEVTIKSMDDDDDEEEDDDLTESHILINDAGNNHPISHV